jgi:hypothetical protein
MSGFDQKMSCFDRNFFTSLESPAIPACQQTGMSRIIEIEFQFLIEKTGLKPRIFSRGLYREKSKEGFL